MTREEKQTIICEALEGAITANGVNLGDKFNHNEIADFANTVLAYLPPDIPRSIEHRRETIFSRLFNEEEEGDYVESQITQLLADYIKHKQNSDLNVLVSLMYNLIHLIQVKFDTDAVREKIQKYNEYIDNQVLFDLEELQKEIKRNPVKGVTHNVDTGYIRLDNNNNFIPTQKSINNLKSKDND